MICTENAQFNSVGIKETSKRLPRKNDSLFPDEKVKKRQKDGSSSKAHKFNRIIHPVKKKRKWNDEMNEKNINAMEEDIFVLKHIMGTSNEMIHFFYLQFY